MAEIEVLKQLRHLTQASMIDCRDALNETGGDFDKALAILKRKGVARANKKTERETDSGIVDAYIHAGGKVGAMVELRCETDFVARNQECRNLAHELCLQIASMSPVWVSPEEIPEELLNEEKNRMREELTGLGKSGDILEKALEGKLASYFAQVCLLNQPYIKNQDETVESLIASAAAKLGENIKVQRFARFDV